MVVDYRHLNALTINGEYPLPNIDELLLYGLTMVGDMNAV